MVEAVQIEVGEELAGQVADRQPAAAAMGGTDLLLKYNIWPKGAYRLRPSSHKTHHGPPYAVLEAS
jgi:hypothetical protein